jgi:hypothetical protein
MSFDDERNVVSFVAECVRRLRGGEQLESTPIWQELSRRLDVGELPFFLSSSYSDVFIAETLTSAKESISSLREFQSLVE